MGRRLRRCRSLLPTTPRSPPPSAPFPVQPAITLVSRRWHRVFYSEPDFWRCVELVAEPLDRAASQGQARQCFAAQASVLRRVGGFVQHLCCSQVLGTGGDKTPLDTAQLAADSGSEWQLGSSVLAHLSPATLQSLRLEWVPVDATLPAALGRFTGLTQLQVDYRGMLPSSLLATLLRLPQLLSLQLSSKEMPGLSAALRQLTRLTQLDVASADSPFSTVFALTRLRKLGWHEQRWSVLEFDLQHVLARLPQLESWCISSFSSGRAHMQVGSLTHGSTMAQARWLLNAGATCPGLVH